MKKKRRERKTNKIRVKLNQSKHSNVIPKFFREKKKNKIKDNNYKMNKRKKNNILKN